MKDQADQATIWPVEVLEAHTMGGFGERMQREREMRSIALEEIAESTKISCRMLRALEEEDFDKLPGGIFNKGFVRAYAKFLGLDEEQAVADFQSAFLEKQQKQSSNGIGLHSGGSSEVLNSLAASSDSQTAEPQPDQAAGFMRAAIIIVFVLGLGGLVWKYWNKPVAEAPAPTQTQTQTQAPTQTTAPPGVNIPVAQSQTPPANASTLASPQKDQSPTSASEPNASDPQSNPASASSGGAADGFRLQINVKETSWVQITADGKVVVAGELQPRATRSIRAAKEMIVKLGNAPGVEVSYNGKALPQFSPDQKTRTLTFTPDGLQQ